jgi:hypothetical protein
MPFLCFPPVLLSSVMAEAEALFEPLVAIVPPLSDAEVKSLTLEFLRLVLKKGKETDKLSIRKFTFLYENVMPATYRLPITRIGKMVKQTLGDPSPKNLTGLVTARFSFHRPFYILSSFFLL